MNIKRPILVYIYSVYKLTKLINYFQLYIYFNLKYVVVITGNGGFCVISEFSNTDVVCQRLDHSSNIVRWTGRPIRTLSWAWLTTDYQLASTKSTSNYYWYELHAHSPEFPLYLNFYSDARYYYRYCTSLLL